MKIKKVPRENIAKRVREREALKERYCFAKQYGFEFVFVDEIVFSVADRIKNAWSNKNENIEFSSPITPQKSVSAVVAISKRGCLHYEIFDSFLNFSNFANFVRELQNKFHRNRRVALFYDGLSVHKHGESQRQIYARRNWMGIMNEAYCSHLNPIEYYFARVKKCYREKLNELLLETPNPPTNTIVKAAANAALEELQAQANDLSPTIKNCEGQLLQRLSLDAFPLKPRHYDYRHEAITVRRYVQSLRRL